MSQMKTFSRKDVESHNTNQSAWVVLNNKVYDITKFLDEHPGGCEVLLEQAGNDGTENFEDIGHSTDAREMREQFYLGDIRDEDKQKYSLDDIKQWSSEDENKSATASWVSSYLIPALIAIALVLLYKMLL